MSKYDVILDVYENQSISKAAQKHNYTQSAVSQTIRNYEKVKSDISFTDFSMTGNWNSIEEGNEIQRLLTCIMN